MLEGKELEGKIGDVGGYYVDVEANGQVTVSLEVEKVFEGGKASSANKVEVGIISILEKLAASTGATWDDNVVAAIKKMLGMV